MSNLPNKPRELALTEAEKENVKALLESDAPVLQKALGVADAALRHYAALEAAKPPEQRAREAQAGEEITVRRANEEKEKLAAKRRTLYAKWCLRDTWLLESEAIPLTSGIEPSWMLTILDGVADLLPLAKSCVGVSLKIRNPTDAPGKWLVTPADWVRWLQEKNYPVNAELEVATHPKLPQAPPQDQPKTAKATQTRERFKAERISALKTFFKEMEERARSHGWDRKNIPVTKADLLAVFLKQYPQYRKLSPASFDDDFTQIGAKFNPGVKHSKTNVLKALFNGR